MPKSAARYWLEVTKPTWTEHIQDINPEDCLKEGISPILPDIIKPATKEMLIINNFEKLWDKINKKRGYSFASNPKDRGMEFRLLEVKK
jgi:hypothetical protein